jgi:hypothetical protein
VVEDCDILSIADWLMYQPLINLATIPSRRWSDGIYMPLFLKLFKVTKTLYTTKGPHYYTTEVEPPNSIVPASCLQLEKYLRIVATYQLISLPARRKFKPLFDLAFSRA